MSAAVLLDTNVASFLYGEKKEAPLYEPFVRDKQIVVSAQTAAEMFAGAIQGTWDDKKRASLDGFFEACPVLYPDEDVLRAWARVVSEFRLRGKTILAGDAWVGATAVAFGIELVAHDSVFQRVKVRGLRIRTAL